MFGFRCSSSVLFQEPNVREVRCSIFQCSRCSKFGFLMFVPRLESRECFSSFLLKHSLDSLDLKPPKNPLGTLWEPLKHFRNLLEPLGAQGSQEELKGVNMLGTNRTERKEKSKKTFRYQGNSMEPPGNP